MRKISLGFMVTLFLLVPLTSHGVVIREVRIDGNRRTETAVIREAMISRVGGTLSEEDLNRDLKALYALAAFADVQIDQESVEGGTRLLVRVKERPSIRNIRFEGNKKIETEELEKDLTFKAYSLVSPEEILQSAQKMKKRYDEDGYYRAEISHETLALQDEQVEMVFHIKENPRVRIRKISFEGNKTFSDRKLRGVIRTKKWNILAFLTKSGSYESERLQTDTQMLLYHYFDNGFLDALVRPPVVTLSDDKRDITIVFTLEEGAVYRIGDVDITGDVIFPKEMLRKKLLLKRGDVFRRSILDKDLQMLTDQYQDDGYFYANVRPIDDRNPEKRIVHLTLEVEKGFQVFFERIQVLGNTITRDKVVRRELKVKEGDLFSITKLRNSVAAVKRLGFFEDVTPSTPRGTEDNQVHLNLDVKEKPTGTFSVGAGFSSVDKFLFNAQVAKDNFLGLGLKGEASAQLGSLRKLFNLSLTDPYFLDSSWLLGASVFRQEISYAGFDRNSNGGELQVGRPLWEFFSVNAAYRFEDVTVRNIDPPVAFLFTDGITSSVQFGVARDARDNRLIAKNGTYQGGSVEVAGGPFGGENEFIKLRYNARFYRPIFKDIIFAAQGRIGYVGSLTGKPVPIYERFFLGGINSVRGYRSRSLGSTRQVIAGDPSAPDYAFVVGGNKEIVFNHELTFPLVPPVDIRGLVFFDAGNAFDDDEKYDMSQLRLSWGFGIRWYSPLGPLRFEFGFPINPGPGVPGQAFEFAIGSSF